MDKLFCRLILTLVLLFSQTSFAWWDAGHKIVAQIAYNHLSEQARQEFNQLTDILKRDYPDADLATWPDHIRKHSIDAYTHWHYVDIPFSSDNSPTQIQLHKYNALWALEQIDAVLLSPKVKRSERARFASFLVHIVGDVHQPLHTISRSNSSLPEGDMGGNLFLVLDPNNITKLISLHALWDSSFGLFIDMNEEQIKLRAEELSNTYPKQYFSSEELRALPSVWVSQSHQLAKDWVYQTAESQLPSFAYEQKSKELIDKQLVLAGYRLAFLLEKYS